MQPETVTIFGLLCICIVLFLLLLSTKRRLATRSESLAQLDSRKRSQSIRYGRLTEQFMPFLESYPYDPHDFRFLGAPIDGIQFTEDAIVLVEFKAAGSQLSNRQGAIRKMVEGGAVRFEIHRIS
jgi:predicted Holliday junction resolvase-like endonuclease